jgi:EmrB/QacA subfamily drug resistance transporter
MKARLVAFTPAITDWIDRYKGVMVFWSLVLVLILAMLDQTVFSAALPTITGEFHGFSQAKWVMTSYILASTIMIPLYGKFGDMFGPKRILTIAVGIFLLGSVVGGTAQSMSWLIIGRAVQGIGGGGLMVLVQAIVSMLYPIREQRAKMMSRIGLVMFGPMVVGPLLGGWLTEHLSWRWAFWMNIPIGIVAMAAVLAFLRGLPVTPSRPRIDVMGILLLSSISTLIVLITSWGGSTYAWDSPVILAMIVGLVVCFVGFVLVERRTDEPVMPGRLFKSRSFSVAVFAGLTVGVAMLGVMCYMPTFMQMVTGYSASASGLLMIPMMGGMVAMSMAMNRFFPGRYRWVPVVGTAVLAAGLLLMSTITATMHIATMCVFMTVFGMGLGLSLQPLNQVAPNEFSVEIITTATSIFGYFRQIGSSIGAAVVGSLFATNLTQTLKERLPHNPLAGSGVESLSPELVRTLPGGIRHIIVEAYDSALTPVFLWIVPLIAVAFVLLLLFLREKPLVKHAAQTDVAMAVVDAVMSAAEPAPMPVLEIDNTSLEYLGDGRYQMRPAKAHREHKADGVLIRHFGNGMYRGVSEQLASASV